MRPQAPPDLPDRAHVLFLQPAFLGDVILSTALIESWHRTFPEHRISIVVRTEAAALFAGHPFLHEVHSWNRSGIRKYPRLIRIARSLRSEGVDLVVNLHRFRSMAWLAKRTGARWTQGFEPGVGRSGTGVGAVPHRFGDGRHETERNHALVQPWVGPWQQDKDLPMLHPTEAHRTRAEQWPDDALVLAPASVWATKRWPAEKWAQLADAWSAEHPDRPVVLLGGPNDGALLSAVSKACRAVEPRVCAGELDLLGAAALMGRSAAVVSNDSAPLHMAGAMGVPVVGVFCSTTPRFGFGALPAMVQSGLASHVETDEQALECKPCGRHGFASCPVGHFKCGRELDVSLVFEAVRRVSSLPSGSRTP